MPVGDHIAGNIILTCMENRKKTKQYDGRQFFHKEQN
jgi:hypothetical protein